jgi:predicted ArsR family transcriptional regulator
MKAYTEGKRPRILDLLKEEGPMNVPRLAERLGINRNAVRQQIAVLEREGLVEMRVERRKTGRPTHVHHLTGSAQALFPQAYGPMALSILRQIRDREGENKVRELFRHRTRELLKIYRERLRGKSAREKVRELARIRKEEGYMARSEGACLSEHHCPIAAVAKEFPAVCAAEKKLFETVLGKKLERTSHIASGAHACVYIPKT